jgi:hypothetical protein
MNVQIHRKLVAAGLLFVVLLIACQKKEVIQGTSPVPTDTSKVLICPDCTFPDTVWKNNTSSGPLLVFRLRADSLQTRLNNLGQVSTPSPTNGAQSPLLNGIIVNYLELMPESTTEPGKGVVLYRSEETTCGGQTASNYCKTVKVKNNEVLFSLPLNQVPKGSYKWLRLSILYTDLTVQMHSVSSGKNPANLAGFCGDNTYLTQVELNNSVLSPTLSGIGNKKQGYWMFYSKLFEQDLKFDGQLSKITVVNPNPSFSNTEGKSFVYGEFYKQSASSVMALNITGNELSDLEIQLSVSTNKCFEWKELTFDGLFQPEIGETVIDFGTRGVIPGF